MEMVRRNGYTFIGSRAEESAQYFDSVLSHGYSGELLYLAWESAHKFSQRMIGMNVASYREGIVKGEKALKAAEFIDQKRKEIFDSLPEQNRSKLLKEAMVKQYEYAEQYYGVIFQTM